MESSVIVKRCLPGVLLLACLLGELLPLAAAAKVTGRSLLASDEASGGGGSSDASSSDASSGGGGGGDEQSAENPAWKKAHGSLGFLAFGVFFPLGAMAARYLRRRDPTWFFAHAFFQVMGLALLLATFVIAVTRKELEDAWDIAHSRLAVATFILTWFQPFGGLLRPKPNSPNRWVFNKVHHFLGFAAIVMGNVVLFLGLGAYASTESVSVKVEYILLAIWLGLLTALAIFLEFYTEAKYPGSTTFRPELETGRSAYGLKRVTDVGPADLEASNYRETVPAGSHK